MHSTLTPGAFTEALREAVDQERWKLFSPSGYEGIRPVLGDVQTNTFRLQKRRTTRNDFAGHFYGQVEPEVGGTRIEGYFAAPRWARYFMRLWIVLALVIGLPIFVGTVRDVFTGSRDMGGDLWVGLVVPPFLIFVGTVLPRFTQRFGRADRRMMVEFVRHVGAAKIDDIEAAVRSSRVW